MEVRSTEHKHFPGGPVAKTLLPMQGTWVQSLARS